MLHCLGHDLPSPVQFAEKFKEVKDAARLAREKSQDKELANTALTIAAPQVSAVLLESMSMNEEQRFVSVTEKL